MSQKELRNHARLQQQLARPERLRIAQERARAPKAQSKPERQDEAPAPTDEPEDPQTGRSGS